MVLVAVIAAGVLINTAGLLQSQAEATGEESAEQVTDRVQVVTVVGDGAQIDSDQDLDFDDGDVDRIDDIGLTISRSPGAGDINLDNAIVEVFANGFSETLVWDEDSSYDIEVCDGERQDNEFGVNMIEGSDGVFGDSEDRAHIVFSLTTLDPTDPSDEGGSDDDEGARSTLSEGDTVSISITTAQGGTAFVEKRAPSTIDSDETYRL